MTQHLISTDEAGYGPNLGPLLIAGTSWQVESDADLYVQLKQTVTDRSAASDRRLLIADSKQIHRTGDLTKLEHSVLSILHALTGKIPRSLENLIELASPALAPQHLASLRQQCWLEQNNLLFPLMADRAAVEQSSASFSQACQSAKVQLNRLECQIVFAGDFNSQVNRWDNKANLLSAKSLALVGLLIDQVPATFPIQIGCDKHGGRSKYAALIQHHLAADYVTVCSEQADFSEYKFQRGDRSIGIGFRARGESFLPTALSSMVAKYLREVLMLAWNRFWQSRVPDLKPTQGYPQDAKRFIVEIESERKRLGIPLDQIWRQR